MPQLLQRSQAGDEVAVRALVQAHQEAVFRLALAILDDPQEAEEAVQDAFVKALNALDSYRGEASFRTWLFAIAVNLCRRRLKKRRLRDLLVHNLQSLLRLPGAGPAHPEEIVIQREAQGALWGAVGALGEKHRLPVLLFYEHELPVAEIARVLDLPIGTVLSRLHSAREKLRLALSRDTLADLRASAEEAGEYEDD